MYIIFDVDETLYDMTQPFERAFQDMWQDKYDIDIYELYTVSRIHSDRVFDQVMAGTMTVDGAGIYRMQHAMADFGYEITEEEALEFQHVYRRHQQHMDISETMRQILDLIQSRGISMAILTNGDTDHQNGDQQKDCDFDPAQKISSLQTLRMMVYCFVSSQSISRMSCGPSRSRRSTLSSHAASRLQ